MTVEQGTTVRTLIELVADDGSLVPVGTTALVIGHAGDRLVLEIHDRDTDTRTGAVAEVWDVRRITREAHR